MELLQQATLYSELLNAYLEYFLPTKPTLLPPSTGAGPSPTSHHKNPLDSAWTRRCLFFEFNHTPSYPQGLAPAMDRVRHQLEQHGQESRLRQTCEQLNFSNSPSPSSRH